MEREDSSQSRKSQFEVATALLNSLYPSLLSCGPLKPDIKLSIPCLVLFHGFFRFVMREGNGSGLYCVDEECKSLLIVVSMPLVIL